MAGIGELSVSVTARTQKATKNIRSFRRTMNMLPGAIASASRSMAGLATAAAGLVGVGAIGNEIRKSFSNIDVLAKTSDKLGIATEKLASLRLAAEESGVASNTLDMALQRMVRRVSEAGRGTGEAVDAIQELGLSAQMLAQMSPDQQFGEIAEAMSSVTNQSDRVRLAFKLFDSQGAALVNTLKIGKEGLAGYEEQAKKLGIAVNRFDASQVEKANDAFARIGKVVEGLTNQIAVGLAPVVEGVSESLVEWGTSGQTGTGQVTAGLRGVGKAIGFVMDGIDMWGRAFKSARAIVSEVIAGIVRQFKNLSDIVADTMSMIPGVETSTSEFTTAFADEMEAAAKRARKQADDAWRKPLPSEGIDSFFANVEKNTKKAREDFEAAAEGRKKAEELARNQAMREATREKMEEQAKGLGGLIARFGMGVSSVVGDVAPGIAKALSSAKSAARDAPGIVDARSAEGFAQLRSSMNGKGMQTKTLQAQKETTKETSKVVTAIQTLAGKLQVPDVLGFGDA